MIVISVSKTYHNAQCRRKKWGKPRCKPFWVAYVLDENENFVRKRISALQVPFYKAMIRRKRIMICLECNAEFVAYVKSGTKTMVCPYCG